jgi:hypothetical protein
MREGILALGASLVLSACASLQIPVDLDPGQYREGTYRSPLQIEAQQFDVRLPATPLAFDPPRPRLTYAELDAALEVSVQTWPAREGYATASLYLAPAGAGGGCASEATYKGTYEFIGASVPLDTPTTVTLQGTLNEDQLAGLNAGRLCLGMAVRLNADGYFNELLFSWRFVRLRVGVGIL